MHFMQFIFITILVIFNINCYIQQQVYIDEKDSGIWSQTTSAQPQIGLDPTQYFLCGYATRQMKWTKPVYNCNCKNVEDKGIVTYKCQWCPNSFYSMRNGFRAIFCSINNWNIQINKTIETGNKDSRNWLTVKCPKGIYVNRVTAKFGCEQQQDIGFVGMQLNCTDLDLNQSFKVEDTTKFALSDSSDNILTNFISSFSLKYVENGQLTGIKFGFEGIPIISGIDIKYGQVLGKSNQTTIQTIKLVNNEKIPIKKVGYLKNIYLTPNLFKNQLIHLSYYPIANNIQTLLPQNSSNATQIQLYTSLTQKFIFDKYFYTKYIPINSSLIVPIPPLTTTIVSVKTKQINTSTNYTAKIQLSDKHTRQLIMEKTFIGNWSGVISSPIDISYEQSQCVGAWGNFNYVVNGDFQLNKCTTDCCIWDNKTGDNQVTGWIPSPQICVGWGSRYNKNLGINWVAQLDATKNTCIKQKLTLNSGIYQLTYDAIARTGYSLETNRYQIKFDGVVIKKFEPIDYSIYKQSYQLNITQNSKQHWIQFCGIGTNDAKGGLVDNIKLSLYYDCASKKIDII